MFLFTDALLEHLNVPMEHALMGTRNVMVFKTVLMVQMRTNKLVLVLPSQQILVEIASKSNKSSCSSGLSTNTQVWLPTTMNFTVFSLRDGTRAILKVRTILLQITNILLMNSILSGSTNYNTSLIFYAIPV